MKYDTGNLWDYPADYRVITTNGIVKNNGDAVMGAGIAAQAVQHYSPVCDGARKPGHNPGCKLCLRMHGRSIEKMLGDHLRAKGNVVGMFLMPDGSHIISFPTKDDWKYNSTVSIVEKSCKELLAMRKVIGDRVVVMPVPGIGRGNLSWQVVKPILERHFSRWDQLVVLVPKTIYEENMSQNPESIKHLVLNVRSGYKDVDVYCGRSMPQVPVDMKGANGFFGNPIPLGLDTPVNRLKCLCEYWDWLQGDVPLKGHDPVEVRKWIPRLKDKKLGCWCAPKLCHCHILATLANLEDGQAKCEGIIQAYKERISNA